MAHPKSELNDRCQQHNLGKPKFKTSKSGAEHNPAFHSEVSLEGVVIGRGDGKQKRDAERQAAQNALSYLDETGNRVVQDTGGDFEGPWPIFPEVLAASMAIADKRLEDGLRGEDALLQIRSLALRLYKETLEALGEVVELEDDA